jgi:hypothetical protein
MLLAIPFIKNHTQISNKCKQKINIIQIQSKSKSKIHKNVYWHYGNPTAVTIVKS